MMDMLASGHLAGQVTQIVLPKPKPWMNDAACRNLTPAEADRLFFPSTSMQARRNPRAVTMCAGCPVREACATFGQDEEFGTWGGVTTADRVRVRQAERMKYARPKLTITDVGTIRERLRAGDDRKQIATDFGMSRSTIHKIANRQSWGHVA